MKRILAVFAALALSACASLSGNGSYAYSHTTQDGTSCTLKVDSGRTVAGGVDMSLDKECGVTLKTGDIGQGRSDLGAVLGFTNGIIGVVTGKPVITAPPTLPIGPPATSPKPQSFELAPDATPVRVVPAICDETGQCLPLRGAQPVSFGPRPVPAKEK